MTLDEYNQELADSKAQYEEEIYWLKDRIFKMRQIQVNAMNTIEEKYIQANRKYPDGHVFATGRAIQSAFIKEDKICYRINPSLTVYQDDL